ncbi:MAG: hypothetical protein D6702_07560 [Planctomycetota bacterium]|nr:MAG: hypothetical protein D6702_07560 [Planctomycetota bacterium]
MAFSRRGFLGAAAGAAAGTAFGLSRGRAMSRLIADLDFAVYPPGGPETFALSVCRECPGGCGTRVRCIGGRPVKLDGNPLHPVNAGRLCPKGQAALQALYHPDRILRPLRREGRRGDPDSFRPADWDEALAEIGVRLGLLRKQGRPEALGLLRGPDAGLDEALAGRFLAAFGSPNDLVQHGGSEAPALAAQASQGIRRAPVPDLGEADLVLSFAGDFLDCPDSPVLMTRAFGRFRRGRGGRRGRFIYAGSRESLTASAADEWVPIRPGSEGLLALGIASVIVAEGLYDRAFAIRHLAGFEDGPDGSPGLRRLLLTDFGLDRVSAATGVPVNWILRIAREFAAARPGLALGPRSGQQLAASLLGHLGAAVLNGLCGSIDVAGGVLTAGPGPLPAWPDLPDDPVAAAGRGRARLDRAAAGELAAADPGALAAAILAEEPYRLEALFVLGCDPAWVGPAPEAFAAAMAKVPLVVAFASLPDRTALLADWILPLPHALETWACHFGPADAAFPVVSLARPVLTEPLGDVRPAGEVFLELARRLGGPVAEALPWPGMPELIRDQIGRLFAARRGAIIGTAFDEAWVRLMERAGWWAPGYRSEEELWNRMLETGGWWDPFYDHQDWQRVLRTESGRFELRPDLIAELDRQAALRGAGRVEGEGAAGDGSLAVHLFEPLALAGGRGAHLPFLQEILDPDHQEKWETWAEIHPETAAELDIRDGEPVEVRSGQGSVLARARLTERVVPGLVALPVGQGVPHGNHWTPAADGNPCALLAPAREALTGLPDAAATRAGMVGRERRRMRQEA